MTYQVQFQRTGIKAWRSDLFETLQAAHAHAAQEQGRLLPEVIVIVEVDGDGKEGRVHEVQVL